MELEESLDEINIDSLSDIITDYVEGATNTFDLIDNYLNKSLQYDLEVDSETGSISSNFSDISNNSPKYEGDVEDISNKEERRKSDRLGSLLTQKKRRKMPHYSILLSMAQVQHLMPQWTMEESLKMENIVMEVQQINGKQSNRFWENIDMFLKEEENRLGRDSSCARIVNQDIWVNYDIHKKDCSEFIKESSEIIEQLKPLQKSFLTRTLASNLPAGHALGQSVFFFGFFDNLFDQFNSISPGSCANFLQTIYHVDIVDDNNFDYFKHRPAARFEEAPQYKSPWAESLDMELFVSSTLEETGSLLGRDLKLIALYQLLLLVSQPSGSQVRNTKLKLLQSELGEMMYRYLRSRLGPDKAGDHCYSLVGLIDRLRRAGEILIDKKIKC